ncbi:TIGR03546 family protein [Elusimicrobiota bacterium]
MFGTGILKSIIQVLSGKKSPQAMAAGFALGAILGLMPKDNLFGIAVFLVFFLTTVDKGSAFMAAFLFTPIGYLLDTPAHNIGYLLLADTQSLTPLWTYLYNTPIIPWTKFNNTVVMGHLVIGLILYIPNYFLFKYLVGYYQKHWKKKVENLAVVKALKGMRIFQLFSKYGAVD